MVIGMIICFVFCLLISAILLANENSGMPSNKYNYWKGFMAGVFSASCFVTMTDNMEHNAISRGKDCRVYINPPVITENNQSTVITKPSIDKVECK